MKSAQDGLQIYCRNCNHSGCRVILSKGKNKSVPVKSRAILITGHGGLKGFQTSRITHFLYNNIAMVVRLSALRTGFALPSMNIAGSPFLRRLNQVQRYSAGGRMPN
jgi:hypothetical protein